MTGSRLFDQHRKLLADSGVSDEVADERGYVSEDTKKGMERRGFGQAQRNVPALLIPLHNVWGQPAGWQARPDDPRMKDGKVLKYETPMGSKMLIDCPPRVQPHLGDPTRPLVITEGSRKADAGVTAGLDCIALLGVWNWRGTNESGGKLALPDWEAIALNDRPVYICFDSDVLWKPEVHQALGRLKSLLGARGADMAVIYLPPGEAGIKVGLDDYLAEGHTVAELLALASTELRSLRPPEPVERSAPEETYDDVPDEQGWQVLDAVAAFVSRFVVFSSTAQRDAVALWAVHTHAIDGAENTPRLAVNSPVPRSGKTRLLEVLELLCRRARHSTSMTAAYLFRLVDAVGPTLLIDEVDTIFGSRTKNDQNEDLRGLINSGHRRGAKVGRCVGQGSDIQAVDFDVFCAVALAGIGDVLPDTVMDRSIVVKLRRRSGDETVEPFRIRRVTPQGRALARRVEAWVHRHRDVLVDMDPEMPAGFVDREADCWEPLFVVADAAGGHWPARARAVGTEMHNSRAEDDPGIATALLADIRTVFNDTESIFSKVIVEKLNGLEEAPWGAWRGGGGFTARDLARMLKEFEIKSKSVREGAETGKGYKSEQFTDVWARYLDNETASTPAPPSVTVRHNVTDTPNGTQKQALTSGNVDCDGVTDNGKWEGRDGHADSHIPFSADLNDQERATW